MVSSHSWFRLHIRFIRYRHDLVVLYLYIRTCQRSRTVAAQFCQSPSSVLSLCPYFLLYYTISIYPFSLYYSISIFLHTFLSLSSNSVNLSSLFSLIRLATTLAYNHPLFSFLFFPQCPCITSYVDVFLVVLGLVGSFQLKPWQCIVATATVSKQYATNVVYSTPVYLPSLCQSLHKLLLLSPFLPHSPSIYI